MEHAPFRRFVTVPILEAPFTDNPSPCTTIRLPRTSDSAKLDSKCLHWITNNTITMLFVIAYIHVGGTRDGRRAGRRA